MSATVKSISFVIVLALIGIGAFLLIGGSNDENTKTSNNTSNATETQLDNGESSQETVTFTVQDVATRNSTQECWTIVDGSVYDITSYVPRHPGGDEILLACGTDGSSLFNERKTESGEAIGSGTPHNSSSKNQLNSFFIGTLEN